MTKFRWLLSCCLLALAGGSAQAQGLDPREKELPRPDPDQTWKKLGDDLWFDPAKREAVILAKVVLRDGPLEHLLCLKGTKEHEAVLATAAEARAIHAALLLTKAEPGHPAKFVPKYEPPTGSKVRIRLQWTDEKKEKRTADARTWVKSLKTEKPVDIDWVFAGSLIVEDPRTKKPFYAAAEGDYFTVANFGSSILDLPFPSSSSDEERQFVAFTNHIAPLGTWVFMHMGPVAVDAKP
jgi:hypothetical protein